MRRMAGFWIAGVALVLASGGLFTAVAQDADLQSQWRRCKNLPVDRIEDIVGAEGHVSNCVLDISINRNDIGNVRGPLNVTLTPAFELNGDLFFQPLDNGKALLNGDLALLEDEVNPFISALLERHLVFQAFHQHLPTSPQIWFVHFRGVGEPTDLARDIRAAINVTRTPLPQSSPHNPTTPLDVKKLADILHGEAEVGEEGVVTVTVNREHGVRLGEVYAKPETGISTTIAFKPLGGSNAAVVPDFSMEADEVDPVVRQMLLKKGWFQGCLYN